MAQWIWSCKEETKILASLLNLTSGKSLFHPVTSVCNRSSVLYPRLWVQSVFQNECPVLAGATNRSNYINTVKFNKHAILEQLQTFGVVEVLTWTVRFPNYIFMYKNAQMSKMKMLHHTALCEHAYNSPVWEADSEEPRLTLKLYTRC